MGAAGMDPVEKILAFLRTREGPASSHSLAERFLRAAVGSEELATRILRPLLEPSGARHIEGTGWVAPREAPSGSGERTIVAAVIERPAGRVSLSPPNASLSGATVALLDPRSDSRLLLASLGALGLPRPASIISFRSALGGVARIPRGAGLEEICAILGIAWLDTEDAAGAARAMATCIEQAARLRGGPLAREGAVAELPIPTGIGREQLEALPRGPGVYRFFDAAGGLLYVGKAANLRRRVTSYFTPGAAGRQRRFQGRIHSMEHALTGSDLEALLAEARLIARRVPEGNVQVEVHERGARYGPARAFALLLPRPDARSATALFVRDGRYLGHVRIGPRGGGLASARGLIGRAIRGRRSRGGAGAPLDRDSEILNSWLARRAGSVSRVELDSFRREKDAAHALEEALRTLLAEPGASHFR
jgi:hypothetical protein